MDNLSLNIRFDKVTPERTLSLIGSVVWAVENGVLTDEEAAEVVAEEMIEELLTGLTVTVAEPERGK